jgi:hypothetical protein
MIQNNSTKEVCQMLHGRLRRLAELVDYGITVSQLLVMYS